MKSGSSARTRWRRWGRTRRYWAGSSTDESCTPSLAAKLAMKEVCVARRRSALAERTLAEAQLHLYASDTYSYAPMTRAAVLALEDGTAWWGEAFGDASAASRSEERRVGKECRGGWW